MVLSHFLSNSLWGLADRKRCHFKLLVEVSEHTVIYIFEVAIQHQTPEDIEITHMNLSSLFAGSIVATCDQTWLRSFSVLEFVGHDWFARR